MGEGRDKVIFLLDKMDHDLGKTMSRKKFLILKIWAICSVGSNKLNVDSFREVNSEQALYLIEILVMMEVHYSAITEHTLPCALTGYLCIFKFSYFPYL